MQQAMPSSLPLCKTREEPQTLYLGSRSCEQTSFLQKQPKRSERPKREHCTGLLITHVLRACLINQEYHHLDMHLPTCSKANSQTTESHTCQSTGSPNKPRKVILAGLRTSQTTKGHPASPRAQTLCACPGPPPSMPCCWLQPHCLKPRDLHRRGVCVYTCVHAFISACVCACMRVCVHAFVSACVCACVRVCLYACMCACVCVCVSTHMQP